MCMGVDHNRITKERKLQKCEKKTKQKGCRDARVSRIAKKAEIGKNKAMRDFLEFGCLRLEQSLSRRAHTKASKLPPCSRSRLKKTEVPTSRAQSMPKGPAVQKPLRESMPTQTPTLINQRKAQTREKRQAGHKTLAPKDAPVRSPGVRLVLFRPNREAQGRSCPKRRSRTPNRGDVGANAIYDALASNSRSMPGIYVRRSRRIL